MYLLYRKLKAQSINDIFTDEDFKVYRYESFKTYEQKKLVYNNNFFSPGRIVIGINV